MSRQRQPGLFDVEERAAKLTAIGDPLVGLNTQIDWEAFRPDLARVHEKDRKSHAGEAVCCGSDVQDADLATAA